MHTPRIGNEIQFQTVEDKIFTLFKSILTLDIWSMSQVVMVTKVELVRAKIVILDISKFPQNSAGVTHSR